MIPAAFDYQAPSSLDDAIKILQENEDDAKILAGGHSLLPLMKLRLAAPGLLVDMSRIPDLAYIRDEGDHVAIGAMTSHHTLEFSDLLRQRIPMLASAASTIGDMQVRNRGTIGGSVAHADPSADLPTIVTALGGTIVARGPTGERTIAASDFFQDIWTTTLEPTEIITEVHIPYPRGQAAQAYEKFRVRAVDWALVGVAVDLTRNNGSIGNASVVLANVGTTPVRASGVEEALKGQSASPDAIKGAAQRASEGLNPSGELKASPEYKKHLARVLTERALARALEMA